MKSFLIEYKLHRIDSHITEPIGKERVGRTSKSWSPVATREVSSVLRSKDVTSSKQKLPFAVREDEEKKVERGQEGAGGNALARRGPSGAFLREPEIEPVGPVPSENHPVFEPPRRSGVKSPWMGLRKREKVHGKRG